MAKAKVSSQPTQESVYSAVELAEASIIFGVSQDIVTAALRMAGIKSATVSEARKVIHDFTTKEVK